MEMPALIWSVLYYLGLFAGIYIITAIGFMIFARLEKDEFGLLLIDPNSLHYRVCNAVYGGWGIHHLENFQIGICGYFWRVFWAFILLPICWTIFVIFQTVKTIMYTPFMFLFGYYPWPSIKSIRGYGYNLNIFSVEARRISFLRVGKLELKPYLVVFPALYGWLFWLYPYMIGKWSAICLAAVLAIVVLYVIRAAADRVKKSKKQRVVLAREYIRAIWRGVCPLLKIKT